MSQPPKIYVAGHRGLVGSAILRRLLAQGHPADRIVTRAHGELDLTDQAAVRHFFAAEKPARSIWQLPKWGAFTPTALSQLSFFIRI